MDSLSSYRHSWSACPKQVVGAIARSFMGCHRRLWVKFCDIPGQYLTCQLSAAYAADGNSYCILIRILPGHCYRDSIWATSGRTRFRHQPTGHARHDEMVVAAVCASDHPARGYDYAVHI